MDDRAAFRQRMEAQLQAWEAELDGWSAQEERADDSVDMRQQQQQKLDDLHVKRMRARQYLDELVRDGDLNALRPQIEQLWSEIRASIAEIEGMV